MSVLSRVFCIWFCTSRNFVVSGGAVVFRVGGEVGVSAFGFEFFR